MPSIVVAVTERSIVIDFVIIRSLTSHYTLLIHNRPQYYVTITCAMGRRGESTALLLKKYYEINSE